MKNVRKTALVFSLFLGTILVLSYCRQDDQIIGTDSISTNELISQKVTTAPSVDGAIDAVWDQATKLDVQTEVPNPGNYLFASYIGTQYDVSMRSLYDNENIYFLIEWNDPTQSVVDRPWYFNPTTKVWARESNQPVFNTFGLKSRVAHALKPNLLLKFNK
jgi:hypothetical protein